MTIIEKLIKTVLRPFFQLGFLLEKMVQKSCKIDFYEAHDDMLIRHKGRFGGKESLCFSKIRVWRVSHEMTFDIVDIVLENGVTARWLDKDNSLISLLTQRIPDKEAVANPPGAENF